MTTELLVVIGNVTVDDCALVQSAMQSAHLKIVRLTDAQLGGFIEIFRDRMSSDGAGFDPTTFDEGSAGAYLQAALKSCLRIRYAHGVQGIVASSAAVTRLQNFVVYPPSQLLPSGLSLATSLVYLLNPAAGCYVIMDGRPVHSRLLGLDR